MLKAFKKLIILHFLLVKLFISAAQQQQCPPISQELYEAVKQGNIELVEQFIKDNPDCIDKSLYEPMGATLLALAAFQVQPQIVELLLAHKADPNITAKLKLTPLILVLSPLADKAIEIREAKGKEAMHEYYTKLANEQNVSLFELFRKLILTKLNERIEIITMLARAGANINSADIDDNTAIDYVSFFDDPPLFFLLIHLSAEFDVNKKFEDGQSLLMRASGSNLPTIEIIKYLIKNGANVNAVDNVGNTALLWAAKSRNLNVLETLIANGANPLVKNAKGETLLHWLVIHVDPKAIEFTKNLLNNKQIRELINEKQNAGWTPLMLAILNNNIELVNYFIKNGANLDILNPFGETILMTATLRNRLGTLVNVEILRSLLSTKEGLEQLEKRTTNSLITPLLTAAYHGNVPAMHTLLNAGANINATNKQARSIEQIIQLRLNLTKAAITNANKEEVEKLQSIVQDLENSLKFVADYKKGMTYAGRINLERRRIATEALKEIAGMRDPAGIIAEYIKY